MPGSVVLPARRGGQGPAVCTPLIVRARRQFPAVWCKRPAVCAPLIVEGPCIAVRMAPMLCPGAFPVYSANSSGPSAVPCIAVRMAPIRCPGAYRVYSANSPGRRQCPALLCKRPLCGVQGRTVCTPLAVRGRRQCPTLLCKRPLCGVQGDGRVYCANGLECQECRVGLSNRGDAFASACRARSASSGCV